MKILVPLKFEGSVAVAVPDYLSESDAAMMAEKLALANILATLENPDAPEEEAFEEYYNACSKEAKETADSDWTDAMLGGVGGTWVVGKS